MQSSSFLPFLTYFFLADLDLGGLRNFKKLRHGLREAANKSVRRVKDIRAENIFTVSHVHWLGMLSSLMSDLGHTRAGHER